MVSKAIRGLGSEVEALAIVPRHEANDDDVWVAIEHKVCKSWQLIFGRSLIVFKVLLFRFDSPKMILVLNDAVETLKLGENEEEEALNEVSHLFSVPTIVIMVNGISQISVNHNKTKLAYTMDSGVVGIVDLSTKISSRMKVKHANVSPYIVYIALTFIQPNRSDGLSNLSPTDLAKY
jgi:hypothetical protein